MQNAGAVGVLIAIYTLSFAATIIYYFKFKTLGNLTSGWVFSDKNKIVAVYLSAIFVAAFVNALVFLLDKHFDKSWAAWPYSSLQNAYALLWLLMLYAELKKEFTPESSTVKFYLLLNYMIQLCAFIVIAVAYATTNQKGLGYVVVQGVLTAHTTLFDYIAYSIKFYNYN